MTMDVAAIAKAKLHILQHALGLDQYGQGHSYRTHFVTGEGSEDHPTCVALTEAGLMTRRANIAIYGGMDLFHATDTGKRYVAEHSPTPPPVSRSKRRYHAWLAADCGLSFGDWLKRAHLADAEPPR